MLNRPRVFHSDSGLHRGYGLGGASPVVSELSAKAALLSAVLSVVDVPLDSIAASYRWVRFVHHFC
jgi:hypothetical protein